MVEETLFQLVKASLFTDEDVISTDWEAVFSEMKKQTIAVLPGEWLRTHPVAEVSYWPTYCLVQQAQWVRVMHGQDQLLKLLDQNGIPCVIIKGAAAAMLYPHPMLRSMGDVDFLVKGQDFEKTAVLLEENGYVLSHEKDFSKHHYEYTKDGIQYELHRRLGSIDESNHHLISQFEEGIDNREYKQLSGYQFPVLPSDLNGLVLILHINQHLRSGLGLRQIIDWMMYVNMYPNDIWSRMSPLLRETDMETLALNVTAMCQKYLGLRKVVEDNGLFVCDELMDYILEKGNFGQKAGIEGKTASFAMSSTNLMCFFKRLQSGGVSRWNSAKKYIVLRPFAWIYQIFRIMGELSSNQTTLTEVVSQSMKGMEQRKLIESLGLKTDGTVKQI